MVRTRPASINAPSVQSVPPVLPTPGGPSDTKLVMEARDHAMAAHSVVRALCAEYLDQSAGVVPEWVEKLFEMAETFTGLAVTRLDEVLTTRE